MANAQAIRSGIKDANTFLSEVEDDDDARRKAIAPGALGADEALINAMGVTWVAKHFGVAADSDAFREACGDYALSWRQTVAQAVG